MSPSGSLISTSDFYISFTLWKGIPVTIFFCINSSNTINILIIVFYSAWRKFKIVICKIL